MNENAITLISFGFFEKGFLEKLIESVSSGFSCQVNHRDGHLDLSEFYDPTRRQYNANALLKTLDSFSLPGEIKTIGLFNIDLYIPILTFIYGQAFLGGRTGIASLYRMGNERYGMAANEQILLDRFTKEVIHELGHMFGLIHCHNPLCVMRSSTYVEDIDQKGSGFCNSCREKLDSQGGFGCVS